MPWSDEEPRRLFQTQETLTKHHPYARNQAEHAGSISSDSSASLRGPVPSVSGGEVKGQRPQ